MSRSSKKESAEAPGNRKLARKIHDDISQKLTVLGLELAVLEARLPKSNTLAPKIQQLSQITAELATSVREVIEQLSAKSK